MNRQYVLSKNLGKDTHVRGANSDAFTPESSRTFQMISGEILIPEPEPFFNQNMVTIRTTDEGRMTSVLYPGAFIEPVSGNLHGSYDGPYPGQMVMVGFRNGNMNDPFVVNKYPYQGTGNTLVEAGYKLPLTKALYNPSDVMIGHFSGSFLSFNTGVPIVANGIPGSVKLKSVTDMLLDAGTTFIADSLITAKISSKIVTLEGAVSVELNGNTNWAVKYTELKTAFDLLKTEVNAFITMYNAHIHITTATVALSPVGVISPTVAQAVPAVADISASQNLKVLM